MFTSLLLFVFAPKLFSFMDVTAQSAKLRLILFLSECSDTKQFQIFLPVNFYPRRKNPLGRAGIKLGSTCSTIKLQDHGSRPFADLITICQGVNHKEPYEQKSLQTD